MLQKFKNSIHNKEALLLRRNLIQLKVLLDGRKFHYQISRLNNNLKLNCQK